LPLRGACCVPVASNVKQHVETLLVCHPSRHGVWGTATSQVDAEILLREFGYPHEDEIIVEVVEDISIAALDENHVMPNAGPMVIRGVWFPRHNL
jgi:hypothetical protein